MKRPQIKSSPYHVNYLQGFWSSYARDILKKVSTQSVSKIPSLMGRFSLRWEHVVIAFLLGLLMMSHSSGHVLRLSTPAPAPTNLKPLPLLKDVSYKPLDALETLWENKLRPYGTYANDYALGNCTFYVASRLPVPNSMGNANNWAYSASLAGLTVSSVPKPGSVAQTAGDSYMGHVAVVESVNPDGSFVISEMNYAGYNLIDSRTTTTAEFPNFIYP